MSSAGQDNTATLRANGVKLDALRMNAAPKGKPVMPENARKRSANLGPRKHAIPGQLLPVVKVHAKMGFAIAFGTVTPIRLVLGKSFLGMKFVILLIMIAMGKQMKN